MDQATHQLDEGDDAAPDGRPDSAEPVDVNPRPNGGGGQAPSPPSALEMLKFAQSVREYHHKALWEEEKHFTWLNSLVLSGGLLVFASDKLSMCSKSTLISILTGFGVLTSLLALKVVRAESRNFQGALRRYVTLDNQVLGANDPEPPLDANKTYSDLIGKSLLGRQNIRDAFQGVFILFALAFVLIEVAFALVNRLQLSICW